MICTLFDILLGQIVNQVAIKQTLVSSSITGFEMSPNKIMAGRFP
jgi:hypothetical protein